MLENLKKLQLRISKNDNVTEEDVRQALNQDIKNYIRETSGLEIDFRNEVKTSLNTFIDSKYGDFVIEYKKPSVYISDKEREQLISYLFNIGINSWGILTNGINLEIFTYSSTNKSYQRNERYSGVINESQFVYIANAISKKDSIILTENNIDLYFGLQKNKEMIKKIFNLILKSKNIRTNLLYNEWLKLFHISDANDKFDKDKKIEVLKFYEELLDTSIIDTPSINRALFSVQTFYAISLKTILFKLIQEKTKSKFQIPRNIRDLFIQIENNEFFRKNNIVNLIDGDFFSWYVNEFEVEDYRYFFNLIKDITNIREDDINLLFVSFYENIFPFHVRHAMGEYYTPLYLAEGVVDSALKIYDKDNPNILDPTCGSGIFILTSLKKTKGKVYGIDINPLSVLTAKINYLLNKFNLENKIEIPIYLGDSTYLPSVAEINSVKCYEYDLLTSIEDFPAVHFAFPLDIVNEENFFIILDEIEGFIVKKNFNGALNLIQSYDSFHYDKLSIIYETLVEDLIQLELRGLNSIWLKIIGNYLKAGSLREIDVIVGNPPWVKWSNLPENYKNKIKNTCRIDGVFSRDTNSGGVDLNISALIAHVTIRDRLSIDGVLGFIMPDSILFNKSFEGFRNMKTYDGREFYLNKLVRWNNKTEKPFDPVSIDFAEYYFTFKKVIEVNVLERKDSQLKNAYKIYSSFNNHYIICNSKEYENIKKVLGENKLKFRSGIGLVKGGHYLLKFYKDINDNLAEFIPYETVNRRQRLSNTKIILEKAVVYPYIKSENINGSYISTCDYYCLFPFDSGQKQPMEIKKIRDNYKHFYNYYMSSEVQKSINSGSSYNSRIQKTNYDIGIFRVGDYTYSEYFLATRDNTKSEFSKVGKIKTHWNEFKMPLFDGHINYVSRDFDDNPISEDFMERLFKLFNRDGVKKYIKYSSDARSISSRLYNDINLE